MKNAKSVPSFYQENNEKPIIIEKEGVILIPSNLAWETFEWTQDYFEKKPKQGFFLWVKETQKDFLNTFIEINSEKISQQFQNLIVVEKDVKVKIKSTCLSQKKRKGKHVAKATVLLKENSEVLYTQKNSWNEKDEFSAEYKFLIEKNVKFKNNIINLGIGSLIRTREDIFLIEKGATVDFNIKMVADKKADFIGETYMYGFGSSKGHLECTGLILDKESKISSIPGIICESNEAELTHEASIGKINEEKMIYLQSRGISSKRAQEILINGFLGI